MGKYKALSWWASIRVATVPIPGMTELATEIKVAIATADLTSP